MRMKPGCPNFDVSQISAVDRRNLAAAFYKAIKRFYADPANLARFEEWNAKRLTAERDHVKEGDFS